MNVRPQVPRAWGTPIRNLVSVKPGIAPAERARRQRARVVDAATAVYSETGHNDARVEQIAARAGISKRTVYEQFRDLAELRQAVYEAALQPTLLRVATVARSARLGDPVRTVLLEFFRSIKENRHLGQIVAYELRQPDPVSVALRQQILSFFAGAFRNGWKRDFRLGLVSRPPNEVTIRAILGGAEALALWIIESDPPVTPEEATEGLMILLRTWCPRRMESTNVRGANPAGPPDTPCDGYALTSASGCSP